MSTHVIAISTTHGRVSWNCPTCCWTGLDIGSETAARAEHARIAVDIASGRLAPDTAEETEGCHRCNGSGVLPTHDGEDEPCTCRPAGTGAEGDGRA